MLTVRCIYRSFFHPGKFTINTPSSGCPPDPTRRRANDFLYFMLLPSCMCCVLGSHNQSFSADLRRHFRSGEMNHAIVRMVYTEDMIGESRIQGSH